MMKHIRFLGSAAAALAVSATFISAPALAQAFPAAKGGVAVELHGGPGYRGSDPYDDRNDYRGDRRGRGPDFDRAIAQCSRAGIEEAWRKGFYSAQYEGSPNLVQSRRGWEIQGRMKLHDRRGYTVQRTVCDLDARGGPRIDFVR